MLVILLINIVVTSVRRIRCRSCFSVTRIIVCLTNVSRVTGVIIAIVVAAVFVLLAFIRVMIYCCSSSDSA